MHIGYQHCRNATAPWQVKPLDASVVEELVELKKMNNISTQNTAWIMHKTIKDKAVLGKLLRQMKETPDAILDDNQFTCLSGNHALAANNIIVAQNSKCPPNFKSLRCNILTALDENVEADVELGTMVRSSQFNVVDNFKRFLPYVFD